MVRRAAGPKGPALLVAKRANSGSTRQKPNLTPSCAWRGNPEVATRLVSLRKSAEFRLSAPVFPATVTVGLTKFAWFVALKRRRRRRACGVSPGARGSQPAGRVVRNQDRTCRSGRRDTPRFAWRRARSRCTCQPAAGRTGRRSGPHRCCCRTACTACRSACATCRSGSRRLSSESASGR